MNFTFDPTTHTYRLDGRTLPSVTQVIRGVGLIDFQGIDQEILDRASAFGAAVHQACHYADQGDLNWDTLDELIKVYVQSWLNFRGDMHLQSFGAIEEPIYNEGYFFAGTPDRINSHKNIIIDIKTGQVQPWIGLQLAAYSILAGMPTARRIAVQLKPDGKFTVHEFTDRKDREVFLAALAVYNWKMAH